jgi:hypothetical protein
MGWSGGAIHYSWFRFTASDTSPDQGTARALPVTCTGCEALSCQGDGGTYTIMGDEVLLEIPGSCSFSFRLGNIASPAEPLGGFGADSGLEAIVSADVFAGEGLGALYEALLYAPGVACDADFTTCAFPPP